MADDTSRIASAATSVGRDTRTEPYTMPPTLPGHQAWPQSAQNGISPLATASSTVDGRINLVENIRTLDIFFASRSHLVRYLVHPPAELRVDLLGSTVCSSPKDPGIGGKGERNLGHVVHPQPCGNGDRNHLDDLDGTVAHDVAA